MFNFLDFLFNCILLLFPTDKTPVSAQSNPDGPVSVQRGEIKKSVQQAYLTPLEVQNHLQKVWENDEVLLNCLLGSYGSPTATKRKSSSDIFFLKVIPVPPSRFRPVSFL